ncbi:MAG: nicotinate mononucleotide-dependent phosphoribosyltransferase CobT [Candidatus Hodarchaeota archaeon]
MYEGIKFINREKAAESFVNSLVGKRPVFILVIGTTETAKIPGITAAGKSVESVDKTPAADAEVLLLGRPRCINEVPTTPDGIPTPAIYSLAAVRRADFPVVIVNSGVKIKPQVLLFDVEGRINGGGEDIRTGKAMRRDAVESIIQKSKVVGENLAKMADYALIAESVPAGTTTALAVMTALGIEASDTIGADAYSTYTPKNLINLKRKVVAQGMKAAGITFGSMKNDPISAISALGDPTIPAKIGLTLGFIKGKKPVILAGSTINGAVLALLKQMSNKTEENVVIASTSYVPGKDLKTLVSRIIDIPIISIDLCLHLSRHEKIKAYSQGAMKEGAGAGGAALAALLKSGGKITIHDLRIEMEKIYEDLLNWEKTKNKH